MFKSFLEWLDDYLQSEGVKAAITGVVGLFAFVGLLGAVLGREYVRGAGAVVVALSVIVVALLILADRRALKKKYFVHRELLGRYCDFVVEHRNRPLILIKEWKQRVFIEPNGDTREILRIDAEALRREVYFLRFRTDSGWNQPKRQLRKVKVDARSIQVNGDPGPRWTVTRNWMTGGRLNSIVHFHTPVLRGERIHIEIERIWPGKCFPLMKEEYADRFVFRFTGLMPVQSAEYQVVLPRGFGASYDTVGFSEPDSLCSVVVGKDDEGRKTFTFHGKGFTAKKEFGMRLELTRPAPRK